MDLLEDAWQSVALFLNAPEVLALARVNRQINRLIDRENLWKELWKRDEDIDDQELSSDGAPVKTNSKMAKVKFLQASYLRILPLVTWHTLATQAWPKIYGREAHIACVLGDYLLVTQGFTSDEYIYVKKVSHEDGSWTAINPTLRGNTRPVWAYGCTLTPLRPIESFAAIRFGGFRAGGYSHETDQASLLRLVKSQNGGQVRASWEVLQMRTQSGEPLRRVDQMIGLSRAYHAAELVLGRYFVIIGGIQSRIGSSILKPVILDTHTWMWMDEIAVDLPSSDNAWPAGRHGCSLIWDKARQRLVLFGGATGCDIIHSGTDVCDVWQLAPKEPLLGPLTHESFIESLPWQWTRLHEDQNRVPHCQMPRAEYISPTRLSSAESLCLGRCHGAHLVARDTVVFVFGSSKPSTNGVLGYDLRSDEFRRPRAHGVIPVPRLCFASAYLPQQNSIWVHSGWSTQRGGILHHSLATCMAVLKLVPTSEPTDEASAHISGSQPVSNHEARLARRRRMSMRAHGGIFGLMSAFSGRPDFA